MKHLIPFFLMLMIVACTSPEIVLPAQTGKWTFSEIRQAIYTNNLGVKDTTADTINGLMIFRDNGTLTRISNTDTTNFEWAYNNTSQNIIITDGAVNTKVYKVIYMEGRTGKWKYDKLFDLGNDETNWVQETLNLERQ